MTADRPAEDAPDVGSPPVFRWSSPDRRWDMCGWLRPTGPVDVPPALNLVVALSPWLAVLAIGLIFYR